MIEIKHISKTYHLKGGVDVVALKDVSIKFPEKGLVFILGKSGSGKSTTLNIIGGLDTADEGEIIIKGKSSKEFKQVDFDSYRNTYLGFIFQEYNILDEFTIGKNISLAIELQGRKATEDEVNEILKEVDLEGFKDRKPNQLSGGQKQRVAIARALVKKPEIILADEPTGALDSKTGIQVFDTLKKLSEDKLVIVVSHDREFAESYGDRVIEFKDGQIISDIEKYTSPSEKHSEDISIVDNKILTIKKGHKLTQDDVNLINHYIESNDAMFSIDEMANRDMRKFARIDEKGNKECFKYTDESKIVFSDDKKFKLIKSRLPFGVSLKMGASSLRAKPFRLFVTIFLCTVAFILFGLADTAASYNKESAAVNSIIDSKVTNISYSKSYEIYNKEYDYTYNVSVKMNDSDLQLLKHDTSIDYYPIYDGDSSYSESYTIRDNVYDMSKSYRLYQTSIGGFSAITTDMVNNLGYSLVGRIPSANDEIVLTKYTYSVLQKYGYQKDADYYRDAKTMSLMSEAQFLALNPTVYINNETYTVVGIIDTEFNYDHYTKLDSDETSDFDLGTIVLENEFQTELQYGWHALAFVSQEKFNSFYETSSSASHSSSGYLNVDVRTEDYSFDYGLYINGYYKFNESASKGNEIYFKEPTKTTMSSKEFILDAYTMFLVGFNYNDQTYGKTRKDEWTDDWIREVYDLTKEYGEPQGYWYSELSENQVLYAQKVYAEIKKEIEAGKLTYNFINQMLLQTHYRNEIAGKEYNGTEYSVVGVYIPGNINDTGSAIMLSDEFYDEMMLGEGKYSYVIGKMPKTKAEVRKIINYSYNNHNNSELGTITFVIKNGPEATLNAVNDILETLSQVFKWIGIVLAVFAALLLGNYIATSISYKKKDIGILRAVGASGVDVFGIFFNEAMIIALIDSLLSILGTMIIAIIINSTLRTKYALSITIFGFGIRQIGLIILIAAVFATIASFIPVLITSLKKPIDAIRVP